MGLANDDLDALKTDPRCLGIYGQYVKLKKQGNVYMGCCPLHADKSPSFAVHADMLWFCHGGCGGGNIMQLIEKLDHVSFSEAVEKVKRELGDWAETRKKVEKVFTPVSESKVYKTIPLSQWTKLEDSFHDSAGLFWLQRERGIDAQTAKRLHIGFVRNLGTLAGPEGADIADKGWIGFPCVSGNEVVSVKYRSIASKRFSRQPGMATALFNTESIDPFEPIYVCEGEIDCLTLESAGFHAVSVPSAGTKLTPEMKDKIMQASCVILAGDTDTPGAGYMQKLWAELKSNVYLLTWPEKCKDANQTLLEHCERDHSKFKTLVDELTSKAKSQPMPSVYSLQETLINGEDLVLSDHPDRMRAPWAALDKMVNIMPGDVVGINATNTGMGKSTFVLQWTLFNSLKYGRTFLNYQTEMRPSEIATMVAAQILRKDRNFLTGDDKKVAARSLEGVQYS